MGNEGALVVIFDELTFSMLFSINEFSLILKTMSKKRFLEIVSTTTMKLSLARNLTLINISVIKVNGLNFHLQYQYYS